jgi:hypothetical protein
MQIRMAGGEVPPRRQMKSKSKARDSDPYGELLEQQARMKDLHQ